MSQSGIGCLPASIQVCRIYELLSPNSVVGGCSTSGELVTKLRIREPVGLHQTRTEQHLDCNAANDSEQQGPRRGAHA